MHQLTVPLVTSDPLLSIMYNNINGTKVSAPDARGQNILKYKTKQKDEEL